jgi:hypothetical protein
MKRVLSTLLPILPLLGGPLLCTPAAAMAQGAQPQSPAALVAKPPAGPALSQPATAAPAAPAQPCADPEYRQFDFWVGDWDVRNLDGSPAGANTVEKTLGGCVIQEHWKGAGGMSGTSFNTYSKEDKKWHQIWVNDREGFFQTAGGLEDGKMVLTGDIVRNGQTRLQRWTWIKLSDDKVLQRAEVSADQGKTWKTGFEATYLRKK